MYVCKRINHQQSLNNANRRYVKLIVYLRKYLSRRGIKRYEIGSTNFGYEYGIACQND